MFRNSKTRKYKGAYFAICLFLAFILLVGCANTVLPPKDPSEDGSDEPLTVSAPVLALFSGETLNPFTIKTQINKEVLALCYGGLYSVDETWTADPVLADGYSFDGEACDIVIRADARFSDGSKITAADCVYSYTLAQTSPVYASRFEHIKMFEAVSETVFRITFSSPSTVNLNLLDIPVIKTSAEVVEYPVGHGAYMFSLTADGLELVPNPYSSVKNYACNSVPVKLAKDYTSLLYDFNYGTVDALCASSSDGTVNFTGSVEVLTYSTNNLVFAVVNENETYLSLSDIFAAGLNILIDRNGLESEVLHGNGIGTLYPFNPSWEALKEADLATDIGTVDDARQKFFEARLYVNQQTGRMEWFGAPVTFNILVCGEDPEKVDVAEYIEKLLVERGFECRINALGFDAYNSAYKKGEYDICIAEIKLPVNMDIRGAVKLSGNRTSAMTSAINKYNSGDLDLRELAGVFRQELPFIPLYYKNRALAVNLGLNGDFKPCETSAFNGVETWLSAK